MEENIFRVAKELHDKYKGTEKGEVLEELFPKLRENENERMIRCLKLLVNGLTHEHFERCGASIEEIDTWLEKQKSVEWGEEDSRFLDMSIRLLNEFGGNRNNKAYTFHNLDCWKAADWLDSLKGRVIPQHKG